MPVLEVRDVHKTYSLGKTQIRALRGVSFSVEPGDFLSIVGPSGCGKTTLLNILGSIDEPSAGEVRIDGEPLSGLSDNEEADMRLSRMGFIFQAFNLIPVLNILENVEFPLILAGTKPGERRARARKLVEAVGLADVATHKPDELSGGQRQRVAIARALVNEPEVVIADEPTANLDSETGAMIVELMQRLNSEQKVSFIFSTHDPDIVQYAKRIIRLRDGLITQVEEQRPAGAGPESAGSAGERPAGDRPATEGPGGAGATDEGPR
ncbi:MAG: ABC transporter ATP-binding protein [Spirochaetota bacterium]